MTAVLFTGYAPVHFSCFEPLYEGLVRSPGTEVFLSGGLRTRSEEATHYDAQAMYAPFGVPAAHVLEVEEIAERDFDVLFCANTKPIAPRSAGLRIQLFHGLSFRNRSMREENMGYDRYFVLGPYMLRGFQQRALFDHDDPRVVEVGFPKTDRLLDGSLNRVSELRAHGLDGTRPVILYAPTGAHDNSLETMGEDLLRGLAATGRYDILVKPHDHPKKPIDWFARLAPLEDEHLRLVRSPDVIPSLFVADLLITDASSVANEYALLDRPIVFVDVPELLAAAAAEDSRLDLVTWGRRAGDVVADVEEAVAAVADGIARPDRHGQARRALASDLFFNPGTATSSALGWLERHLALAA